MNPPMLGSLVLGVLLSAGGGYAVEQTMKACERPARRASPDAQSRRPEPHWRLTGAEQSAGQKAREELKAHFQNPEQVKKNEELAGQWSFDEAVKDSKSQKDATPQPGLEPDYRSRLSSD